MLEINPLHRIRSFVGRNSRKTVAQARAQSTLFPIYGLSLHQKLNVKDAFQREAPVFLEIGFGSGLSLLACAKAHPEYNFIGVETHEPGIGALLLGIQEQKIENIRLYHGDVNLVLEQAISDNMLAGVQIFFPDPWPKRRHQIRRLIQDDFIKLILAKLKCQGHLQLATDWEDYAVHMMAVLSRSTLTNAHGVSCYALRSAFRPLITKFEGRAIREGRAIWELDFIKPTD